ncbi:hypothetical protein TURU_098496 [Turdus rufiventris]|nr:hypothetical protein TURU_098496 [Turdus rufiventris]
MEDKKMISLDSLSGISMKSVADLARGNKRTIKITSDHIFLAEENTIFKWVTVCTMNVQLLDKYPFIEMKGEEEIQRNMMVYTDGSAGCQGPKDISNSTLICNSRFSWKSGQVTQGFIAYVVQGGDRGLLINLLVKDEQEEFEALIQSEKFDITFLSEIWEDLMSEVMIDGHLGYSNHETTEFKISVDRKKCTTKTSNLDMRTADFRRLRELMEELQCPAALGWKHPQQDEKKSEPNVTIAAAVRQHFQVDTCALGNQILSGRSVELYIITEV